MYRLTLIAEFKDATTRDDAERLLDAFRESTLPDLEHGITLYQADPVHAAAPRMATALEHAALTLNDLEKTIRTFVDDDAADVAREAKDAIRALLTEIAGR